MTLCYAELLAVIPNTRFIREKRLFGKQSSFSVSNSRVSSLAPSQATCRNLPFLSASMGTLKIFQGTSLPPSPHPFVLPRAANTQRHSLPGNQQAVRAWESVQCFVQSSSEMLTPYCRRENKQRDPHWTMCREGEILEHSVLNGRSVKPFSSGAQKTLWGEEAERFYKLMGMEGNKDLLDITGLMHI